MHRCKISEGKKFCQNSATYSDIVMLCGLDKTLRHMVILPCPAVQKSAVKTLQHMVILSCCVVLKSAVKTLQHQVISSCDGSGTWTLITITVLFANSFIKSVVIPITFDWYWQIWPRSDMNGLSNCKSNSVDHNLSSLSWLCLFMGLKGVLCFQVAYIFQPRRSASHKVRVVSVRRGEL